jgi:hypothetical protein
MTSDGCQVFVHGVWFPFEEVFSFLPEDDEKSIYPFVNSSVHCISTFFSKVQSLLNPICVMDVVSSE